MTVFLKARTSPSGHPKRKRSAISKSNLPRAPVPSSMVELLERREQGSFLSTLAWRLQRGGAPGHPRAPVGAGLTSASEGGPSGVIRPREAGPPYSLSGAAAQGLLGPLWGPRVLTSLGSHCLWDSPDKACAVPGQFHPQQSVPCASRWPSAWTRPQLSLTNHFSWLKSCGPSMGLRACRPLSLAVPPSTSPCPPLAVGLVI